MLKVTERDKKVINYAVFIRLCVIRISMTNQIVTSNNF